MTEHKYALQAETTDDHIVTVSMEGMDDFEVTSAPDWYPDAKEGLFSPQTMFVSASASCLILSVFKAAKRLHTDFKHISIDALGTMGENDDVWSFAKIELKVKAVVENEGQIDKISRAIDLAHKTCPIANTLKCPTIINKEIIVG
ncbi:MAG: hypothetical protein GF411_15095 [Candidatus Lokiarchaeota archaeon]|nr:hypothetical protein [Candidatus Lokiarchaeota archaeon]